MSRFVERLKLRRQSEAAQAERQRVLEQARQDADRVRVERETQVRIAALRNSIVPQSASELYEFITGKKIDDPSTFGADGHISITVMNLTVWTKLAILIDGQPDGSVTIGDKRLNVRDKYDPKKVDRALENAYNYPKRVDNPDNSIAY